MSSLLYALGRLCYRRWRTVFALWFVLIAVLGVGAGLLGTGPKDVFSAGSESFLAIDRLSHTFPEVSGAAGQVVVTSEDGKPVDSPENKARILEVAKAYEKVDQVAIVIDPWHELIDPGYSISKDRSAALIQVQMEDSVEKILIPTQEALEHLAHESSDKGLHFQAGGGAWGPEKPVISYVEGIGLVVALLVLTFTFGSLVAAGLPLATALVGIAGAMSIIWAATRFLTVGSTAPFLALMIGLAVGIDYSLFILARHRDEMSRGVDPEESTGRAVATAGSAVVFAGVTVIIALIGLAVTGLPFLAIMGIAAALAVVFAIAVSLTLTPAALGVFKHRLAAKPATPRKGKDKGKQKVSLNERWLNLVLRFPKFFVIVVTAVMIALTIPALSMKTTLPDNGTSHHGSTQRETYETIAEEFGVGYNGQLVVTADLIPTTKPLEAIADIKRRILNDPAVSAVPIATPNPPDADTMLIQVVPETGPNDEATTALTHRLRAMAPSIKEKWGLDIKVTGMTALTADLNDKLRSALLPFGLLVMGLSLLLLAMVFRSIAVPIKATVNFLLSVGATFGAVVLVFQEGWFAEQLNVVSVGPIVCFLPILLISLLFGLSMDYEVFLVSRIREEYVHGASAIDAIRRGYMSSSKVITAAAVIMIAVFAAFVPHGDASTQPIAFALALGVFIDAFMVRITLVPAVMALLGDKAWWMPKWLDKRLIAFDVEGEGVTHQIELADWPTPNAHLGIHADRLTIADRDGVTIAGPVSFELPPTEVILASGGTARARTALAFTLTGRMKSTGGRVKVAGYVVPEQMLLLRPHVALVRLADSSDPREAIRRAFTSRTDVLVVDGLDLLPHREDRDAALAEIHYFAKTEGAAALVTVTRDCVDLLTSPDPTIRVLDLQTSRVTPLGAPVTEGALA